MLLSNLLRPLAAILTGTRIAKESKEPGQNTSPHLERFDKKLNKTYREKFFTSPYEIQYLSDCIYNNIL